MSMDMNLLNEAIAHGILDLAVIQREVDMANRERYLAKHVYKIYQGKDGRWHTYLPDKTKARKRRHIKRNTKEEIEELLIEYYKQNEYNPTVEDIFREWNERRVSLGKIKDSTATRFDHDFEKFFTEFGKRYVKTIDPDDVTDFLEAQLAKHHLTQKGFSNLKTLMRGILKRAKKLKLFNYSVDLIFSDLDVSDREFRKVYKDDSTEIFYDDEIQLILDYCKTHSEDLSCLGVILLFVSGIRVGEVVTLKRTDLLEHEVFVHRTETQFRKNNKNYFEVSEYPKTPAGMRRVVIPDSYAWLLESLRNAGDETGFIFIGMHGKRMHTSQIRKRLYQICRKLGIPVRSPHKLRKTYGTILLDNHIDNKLIERQMGHVDISTTENHYHRDRKRIQQKRDIINSITEFS